MRIGDVIMAFSASSLVTAASCVILQSSMGAIMRARYTPKPDPAPDTHVIHRMSGNCR